MNLFYNAEVIVAPHGAGLSHLVFADLKVRVLELFAPIYVQQHYWHISNVMGFDYHYLLGEDKGERCVDSSLFLDLAKVEKALATIL